MHIGIGAAILILGLLWLATSKAGLKVLGVLAVVVVVGGGAGYVYWGQQDTRVACLARLTKSAEYKAYTMEAFRRAAEQTSCPQR